MVTFKFQYLLASIWFAIMSYICFGYGTGDNYKAAPLFIGTSLFILCIYGTCLSNVIKPFKVLALLYVITSVNFLMNANMNNTYLQYTCYSLTGCLTAISSFCMVRNNPRILKLFAYFMLAFFVVGIVRFFKEQSLLDSFYAVTSFYFLLFSLPLILLCTKKKYFHLVAMIVTIIFCVLSLKRSAVIASILLLLMYLLIVAKSGIKQILYVATLLIVALFIANHYLSNSDFGEYIMRLSERLENLEQDKGSGRGDVIEQFFKNDVYDIIRFPDILIGRGFGAYHKKYSDLLSAHNDFIEIVFSTGLIGLYCLCSFFKQIFKRSVYFIKRDRELAMPYSSTAFLFFFYAFASTNFNFYYLSLPLFLSVGAFEGYILSTNKNIQ